MTLDLPSLRALAHLVGWHRGCGLACGRGLPMNMMPEATGPRSENPYCAICSKHLGAPFHETNEHDEARIKTPVGGRSEGIGLSRPCANSAPEGEVPAVPPTGSAEEDR